MPTLALNGRAVAVALVVLLIGCVPVHGSDPADIAAASSTSGSDIPARINDLERKVHAIHLKIQAFNSTANPTNLIPDEPVDKLQALYLDFRDWCDTTTPRFLLSDTAFWLSIVAILQWHIRFHLGEFIWYNFCDTCRKHDVKPFLLPRKVGVNILILVAYYDTDPPIPECLHDLMKGRAFLTAMFVIVFDTFVLFYGFMLLGSFLAESSPGKDEDQEYPISDWLNPVDLNENDGVDPPKFKATNIYEDLTTPFRKTAAVFVIQAFLAGLYLQELNSDKESHSMKNVAFDRWIIAVVFQLYAGDEQVGEAFNGRYWRYVLQYETGEQTIRQYMRDFWSFVRDQIGTVSTSEEEGQCLTRRSEEDEKDERQKRREEWKNLRVSFKLLGECWYRIFRGSYLMRFKLRTEWSLRRLLDIIINSWARGVILYTVPIMVSVETPLDFVKDLTAVMFITVLDNVEGRSIKEILVKLKFNLFYKNVDSKDTRGAWKLNEEERGHVEENVELYQDISMLAPQEWDQFIGSKASA